MERMRIGFVGLGLMGAGMVKNLLAAGFPVVGYDIDATSRWGVERLLPRRPSLRPWKRSSCRFRTPRW